MTNITITNKFHTHIQFIYRRRYTILANDSVVKENISLFSPLIITVILHTLTVTVNSRRQLILTEEYSSHFFPSKNPYKLSQKKAIFSTIKET